MEMLNIGGTPYGEACVQVSENNYEAAMRFEAEQYKNMLAEEYPEPENGYFKVKSFRHDFGVYYEVVAMYDPDDEEAVDWALEAESGIEEWDEGTLAVLNENPAWVAAKKS